MPNGLSLRRDLHRLFDLGYVTIRPDLTFAVGDRLRTEYDNRKVYYELGGRQVLAPSDPALRPSEESSLTTMSRSTARHEAPSRHGGALPAGFPPMTPLVAQPRRKRATHRTPPGKYGPRHAGTATGAASARLERRRGGAASYRLVMSPTDRGRRGLTSSEPLGAEDQVALRYEAMRWLASRSNDGADFLHSDDLLDYEFNGHPFRLMDAQAGIRKPAGWSAALSIRTVYRPEGKARPYEDRLGPEGLLEYKWRGTDPEHADNRALRVAMQDGLPLIWFFGVGTALYQAIFPMYVLREESNEHQFVIDPDVARPLIGTDSHVEARLRKYVMREVKHRVHQPVFRATVLRAYQTRCAVCSLQHTELLDPAHIVPDRDEKGIASVRNGLALCKIHHAAFDAQILGIRPDFVIEIREDVLDEVDGPMLRYGLQGMHDQRLRVLPRVRAERPDPELLELTYRQFRGAG